jgi:hypothetical protein
MRRVIIAVLVAGGLAASWTTWANPPTEAKPPDTLDKRITVLEKRVTELEGRVAELEVQPKVSSSLTSNYKLIGNWAVSDGHFGVVGLRFTVDGVCRVATADREMRVDFATGTYDIVGKAVILILTNNHDDSKDRAPHRTSFFIISVDDKTLKIQGQLSQKVLTFERQ